MLAADKPFLRFVREERVFCAALAHLLMEAGPNLSTFLDIVNSRLSPDRRLSTRGMEDAEIYLEFSYLRDDWYELRRKNDEKRTRILSLFARIPSLAALSSAGFPQEIAEFNGRFMGKRGLMITKDIVYPGQWTTGALEGLAQDFGLGGEGFRDLCRFKWAFNIKPDLVALLPGSRPLCVEAKLESRLASYPVGAQECARFDRVVGPRRRVGQIELQQFMFEKLLDTPCQPVVIGARAFEQDVAIGDDHGVTPFVGWAEIFARLDLRSSIPFVRRLLSENEILPRQQPRSAAGRTRLQSG